GETDEIGIEAGLREDPASDRDGDRHRQDRPVMGLDEDRVARCKTGEYSRVGIPGRERVAADDERDPARDDRESLLESKGVALALRLLPVRLGRVSGLLGIGVR